MMHIDPIPVKEELQRLSEHVDVMKRGMRAADALLWFSEYGSGAPAIKPIEARLVASSTPKVEQAQHYVSAAAQAFAQDIMERAIAMARHDFQLAERARRNQKAGQA